MKANRWPEDKRLWGLESSEFAANASRVVLCVLDNWVSDSLTEAGVSTCICLCGGHMYGRGWITGMQGRNLESTDDSARVHSNWTHHLRNARPCPWTGLSRVRQVLCLQSEALPMSLSLFIFNFIWMVCQQQYQGQIGKNSARGSYSAPCTFIQQDKVFSWYFADLYQHSHLYMTIRQSRCEFHSEWTLRGSQGL